jgi:hypothetical protein
LTIQYQEQSLADVVQFWVDQYKPAWMVEHHEFFIDAAKEKLILKLYMRGAAPAGPAAGTDV